VKTGQSLALYPSTALPVHLRGCKENGATRQRSLLQHPSTAVELSKLDVAMKVVDSWAHVERPRVSCLQLRAAPGRTVSEEALKRRAGRTGADSAVRVAENLTHSAGLAFPVILVVLDNTQRVDPDILDAEPACYSDCVPERAREALNCDTRHKLFDVVLGSAEFFIVLERAPTVAESYISRGFDPGGTHETDRLTNFYEARRHRPGVPFVVATTRTMG
jgi:hypothetical protein